MNATSILAFLRDLSCNNNRVWFAENRARYEQAKADFEQIVTELIAQISVFDSSVKMLEPKSCIFRIFRDVRFHDKDTPYKTHFGAYIAPHGGRKSDYAGYYFHLQPDGNSMLCPGIWSPEPAMLKALRQAVYDNFDEFLEIIENEDFKKNFDNSFFDDGMLKTAPKGFPKDFSGIYYLKLRHYIVNLQLSDSFFENDGFLEQAAAVFRAAYPLNRFLNYTVDEVKGI